MGTGPQPHVVGLKASVGSLFPLLLWQVSILRGLYEQWEQDPNVNLIVLKSDGRAFCAGGDVRACYNAGKEGRVSAWQCSFMQVSQAEFSPVFMFSPPVLCCDE